MNPIRPKSIFSIVALAAACTLGSTALAQYVWLDGGGIKQYSDMPPPASVPASRILKTPASAHASPSPAAAPASVETEPASSAKSSKAPPTLADKNADFIKRRSEQAEHDKKAAEQERIAGEKSKACDRARQYQQNLTSGMRIASTNKNGERVFLDEAQRAKEMQEAKNVLKDCGNS